MSACRHRSSFMANPDSFPEPLSLSFGQVTLRFSHIIPRDELRGLVPAYHFRIFLHDGDDAGHINFRIGDTDHVILCVGHIGYEIAASRRGHGYAFQACQAIALFVRAFREKVIITSDPDNPASLRTIEKLGARFVNEILVPVDDPHYLRGSRFKRRYEWSP